MSNAANREGQTALMVVARTGNVEAAQLLIGRKAEVNAKEEWRGQTALMWAAAERLPAMVRLLVDHGADVNARSNVNLWDRDVTAEPRASTCHSVDGRRFYSRRDRAAWSAPKFWSRPAPI